MLKFFRRIRQRLLSENAFSKYLLYAIGEIILVVIGILIALQINNWNEGKKKRAQEQELLTQLHSEFTSNLEQLDQKTALRNQMISSSLKLLNYIDYPETLQQDSLLKNITFTVLTPTFDPIVNDINSSERIQLLSNSILKEKLARWTSEVVQVTEEEQTWMDIRDNNYWPMLSRRGITRNLFNQYWKDNVSSIFHLDKGTKTKFELGNSKKEINVSILLDEPQLESNLAACVSYAKLANSQAFSLRKRIVEILDLIEKDLK